MESNRDLEALSLRDDGISMERVAAFLGMGRKAAQTVLNAAGNYRAACVGFSPEQAAEIIAAGHEGEPGCFAALAKLYGRSILDVVSVAATEAKRVELRRVARYEAAKRS